jgi:eukaryotic-like serine/threonine-protein kinase
VAIPGNRTPALILSAAKWRTIYEMNREETIFEQALGFDSPAAREAYLREACAGDEPLFQSLQGLLRVHDRAGKFLDPGPPAGGAAANPSIAALLGTMSVPVTEKPGDRIGRYKLLEKIGEGGCGVVYMAEQEEPVRRRVALKVIKLGMDTEAVIARFEAERQALALMDHPNIAKVLDAGATDVPLTRPAGTLSPSAGERDGVRGPAAGLVTAGRPYFVMELVRGTKITEFCDHNNLTTPQRLDLFMQVCRAIQHAHQKGIIHRDIKPSNILVTLHDGVPVPKVIDFGIAKATQGRLTDKTVFTAFQQFLGTPAYMSPEQAEMTGLDIDTRSDIYSLGVLLYELLTGKTPFDSNELLEAGLDAMRRTIREQEPERPSTKLSTMVKGELTTTANRRQTEPPKLVHAVRGDLDWIVMKALEKDRARRYETANGLARDIQRHLDNEPVLASPPSQFYRFQKLVRRNKVAVSAASAVLLCLLLGLVGAIWGFLKEREARQAVEALRAQEHALLVKAQTTERISKAKKSFERRRQETAEQLLNEIPPATLEPDPDHASLRRMLGWWYAAHEEYDKSASNCAILDRVDGLDDENTITLDRLMHCVALIQGGDIAGYNTLRQTLTAEFLQTTDPVIAEHLCRACLLLPADEAFLKKVGKLYELIDSHQADLTIGTSSSAWFGLAMALIDYRRGDFSKATSHCQACLDAHADYYGAYLRVPAVRAVLAMSYHQLHRDEEAQKALAEARRGDFRNLHKLFYPQAASPLFDALYGQILAREAGALIEGRPRGEDQYYPPGEANLGLFYASGRAGDRLTANLLEAVRWYSKAVEHGSVEARCCLAWMLATCPDAKIRNGTNAVRLAEEAAAATQRKDLDVLETLAGAYAETGEFGKAVAVQKEAMSLAADPDSKKALESHLKLYESGKPCRE